MAGLALEKAEDVFSLCSLLATGKGLIVQREKGRRGESASFHVSTQPVQGFQADSSPCASMLAVA